VTICLSAIVRNEAHVVRDMLDSVAPHINSWVIVDTGSTDGTRDVIREHMARLGIPGELHEREWRNFGENRSEALELAQGRGDFVLMMDADDLLVGAPDFSNLTADAYAVRINFGGAQCWRLQLFRNKKPWRYEGAVNEIAVCDERFTAGRLDSAHIEARELGSRDRSGDIKLLLAELERNPDDARQVFYLAQTRFEAGDYTAARHCYERRIQLGGFAEETYFGGNHVHRSGLTRPASVHA
jgi:glycosyltransferase involved in cell wall biosynthesis